jgi:polyisoprenoid-binding protein YceI
MTPTLRPALRVMALVTALAAAALPAATLAQSPSAAPAAPAASPAAAGLDGTWTIDRSIGSFDYDAGDFSGSWVGYRAQEELVGVGGTEAVGRTPSVDGSITIAGDQVTAANLTADLTTLRSNEPMRDGQLGHQGVQTDQFPTATFVLTQPIDLGTIPAEGTPLNVNAVGDLTIHGVTKNVTIPLATVQQGDIIGAAGSITFTWGDFGMTQPQSMRVVSLANDVTLELQVFFRHGLAGAVPSASPAA